MREFESLAALVRHATRPSGPQLYRRLYSCAKDSPHLEIQSIDEFRKLPVITKDDLIACPLSERSFIPLSQLDHLRTSSGTSGKPPLFSPRTHVQKMEYRLRFHDFKAPFMAFTVPLMPHWHEQFQSEHGRKIPVVAFDPSAPDASVRIARIAGIDAFSIFVYHATLVGEAMKRENMTKNIRYIEITGETCSREMYEYLHSTFPNATIVQSYAASEVEDVHIGMPCKPVDGTEPLAVYHPKDTHYLEIMDSDTGDILEPSPGVEGDLLITAYPGEPSALPLIRFKIGDTVRIVEKPCKHSDWSFTVIGRTDMDFLKIPGGVLRADEVERVLRLFSDRITDQFQLRVQNVSSSTTPRLQPILYVEARETVNLEELADSISQKLRVSPSFTWAMGVTEGRYMPLICKLFTYDSEKKKKRIVFE